MDNCPDVWFRYKVQDLWNKSLETAAKFVGADPKNVVFVPNTTSGINTVLRCLDIHEGNGILITNQTYGAVQMTAREVCQTHKAKLLVLNITFPTSDMTGLVNYHATEVVQHYEKVLQENPSVKLAIIDAITSISAVKLPFKRLVEVCHKHDVLVLVDGAHAPGHIPLDLERLGADFFVGKLMYGKFTVGLLKPQQRSAPFLSMQFDYNLILTNLLDCSDLKKIEKFNTRKKKIAWNLNTQNVTPHHIITKQ